jgi:aspartate aminotransferase
LVQRALAQFDFNQIPVYLEPIKRHLRDNAETLGEALSDHNLGHVFYQPTSAFYYLLDFSQTPVIERFRSRSKEDDYSVEICEELLEEYGLALVPGEAFGCPNTARMSLVLEKGPFKEALDVLMKFLLGD